MTNIDVKHNFTKSQQKKKTDVIVNHKLNLWDPFSNGSTYIGRSKSQTQLFLDNTVYNCTHSSLLVSMRRYFTGEILYLYLYLHLYLYLFSYLYLYLCWVTRATRWHPFSARAELTNMLFHPKCTKEKAPLTQERTSNTSV